MRNNLKFLHIVLLSAALLAANREAAAQLISGTFSGAVTLLSPASSDLLPAVELGSPMQISFTYQADAPIGTATTDRVRSYFYDGGVTHAALSFVDGAATFETNALTLTLIPSFEFGRRQRVLQRDRLQEARVRHRHGPSAALDSEDQGCQHQYRILPPHMSFRVVG